MLRIAGAWRRRNARSRADRLGLDGRRPQASSFADELMRGGRPVVGRGVAGAARSRAHGTVRARAADRAAESGVGREAAARPGPAVAARERRVRAVGVRTDLAAGHWAAAARRAAPAG